MGFLQNAGEFCRGQLHLLWTHTPSHMGDLEPELYKMPIICMRCDRRSILYYRCAWAPESQFIYTVYNIYNICKIGWLTRPGNSEGDYLQIGTEVKRHFCLTFI